MPIKKEFADARARWNLLTFYEKFEHAVILFLTGLVAIVVLFAVWNLTVKIVASILLSTVDPTDYRCSKPSSG